MDNAQEAILIIESGVASTAPLSIGGEPQILGKSNDADISIENPFVSRTHCKIEISDGQYKISDLGSTNGTSINGTDIEPNSPHDLNNRDLISLGRSVNIRFLVQSSDKTVTFTKTIQMDQSDFTIDSAARKVWFKGSEISPPFTPKEFSLLELLHSKKSAVVSKDEISNIVWPERLDGSVSDEEIGQCVRRIRRKLGDSNLIKTHRGVGYQLV